VDSEWRRRDVLIGAAAGGVVLGTGAIAMPARAGVIVADTRLAESRAFAGDAAWSSARIAWFDGDVTDVYAELDLLWRRAPHPVAGLTAPGAFFCLERLAMDRGLRVASKTALPGKPPLIRWSLVPKWGASA
jgi:hypothetical protein